MLNSTSFNSKPISEQFKSCWHNFLIEHPKNVLVTEAALLALSLTAYRSTYSPALYKLALGSTVFLGSCLALEWSHLFREVWHGLLNCPYEPTFKPTFKEEKFLGNNHEVLATMEYNNKLPIFTFSASVTDPAQRGYIHGYMLAEQIVDVGQKALRPMLAFLRWEKGEKNDSNLRDTVKYLNISDEVRNELLGIVKGVEEKFKNIGKKCPTEVADYIFAAHVMTDHYKAIGSSLGCSAVVYREPGNAPVVGRNLDWVSMGYLGRHLFVRRYNVAMQQGSRQVNTFTFPSYIGALTAWNSDGLIVLVNELGKTSIGKGKPYSLLTKELIENCSSVEEAAKWLNLQQQQCPCASSVSMVLVDATQAKICHFYPEGTKEILVKDLLEDGILSVSNHAYDHQGNVLYESICERKSIERLNRLHSAIQTAKNEHKTSVEVVEAALKGAGVAATIGVFIADLSSQKKKILLDDFFAHQQIDRQPYLKI